MRSSCNLALLIYLALVVVRSTDCVSVFSQHPDNEYILDHQVSYEDALKEAKKLEIRTGRIPGCKACTSAEMSYCKNGSVMNDHCCCDGSYNKVFPFVEHSCRVGPEECKVLAGDCAEYTRLRECCCHPYLASVWRYLASGAESRTVTDLFVRLFAIVTLQLLVIRV